MRWKVNKSHKVRLPRALHCAALADLRDQLQTYADGWHPAPKAPALGQLQYRYELDGDEEPIVVHAYFENKNGLLSKFAKLTRA